MEEKYHWIPSCLYDHKQLSVYEGYPIWNMYYGTPKAFDSKKWMDIASLQSILYSVNCEMRHDAHIYVNLILACISL